MFKKTAQLFPKIVIPIVVAWRTGRGKLDFSIGAGMIVNSEGGLITAGHIIKQIIDLHNQTENKPSKNSNRATHFTVVIGNTKTTELTVVKIVDEIDFGLAIIKGYVPPSGQQYPKFRVDNVHPGEFLCRAGFPFIHRLAGKNPRVEFNNGSFNFIDIFPTPLFINEAMVSRFMDLPSGTWIETTSPGLRGQSGGPLADTDGLICGMQVNTEHYPLDFSGIGRNQMLNVGRALHVKSIVRMFEENNIEYLSEGNL